MSTTRGVRILVGSALASSVILLGGCSSSGTVSAGANGGSNPLTGGVTSHSSAAGTTGGTTGGSSSSSSDDSSTGASSSSSSSDDSSSTTSGGLGGSDPGCQAAISDLTSGSKALGNAASDPAGAIAGVKAIGDKMHADAGKSTNPAHASAINKVGDDYAGLASSIASGKQPDISGISNDDTALITACSG